MIPFFNDFGSWLQGLLFVLIIYHISFYIFTKDKSFSLYALYLALVLIYLIPKTNNTSSIYLNSNLESVFNAINWIIQMYYWIVYCWFSIHFLNIEQKNKKLALVMYGYIKIASIVCLLVFVVDIIFFKGAYISYFFIIIFSPVSLVVIGVFMYTIYKFKSSINKFYLIGLFFYLFFSVIALLLSMSYGSNMGYNFIYPIHVFKIGVFLEAIILSIGLGYKYHIYRKERDVINIKLIKEFKKNEVLKQSIQEQLEKDVVLLSKKAESEKLEKIKAKYDKELSELKMSSLRNQMNPHFIFNSLNAIKLYIIENDKENAVYYLNKFSKLIRKILATTREKEITLAEEIETMELYINIENIRFNNEIDYTILIDQNLNLNTIKMPSLILQPFIENAIWHGLASKQGNKKLNVIVKKENQSHIKISIIDNGIGRKKSAKIALQKIHKRKSIGIKLTKERLVHFSKDYQNNYSIIFNDLYDAQKKALGTKVVLKIPIN